MFDIGELFFQVSKMKAKGKVLSNNFMDRSAIERFSAQDESILTYNEDAIALICRDNGIVRLYFYLLGLEKAPALKALLRKADQHNAVVVDCVGKENYVNSISDALCKNGFIPYTRMTRWRSGEICLTNGSAPNGIGFRVAVPEQADEVLALLFRIFDPYVSKLPNKKQLEALIKQDLVFCAVHSEKVIAAVCLQRVGRAGIYIYQIAVSKEQRSVGLGGALLQFALRQFTDCSNFTSWIESGNEASQRLHQALGMRLDGLVDTILIYKTRD